MNENPETLVFTIRLPARDSYFTVGAELGHGIGDCIVETTIERAELVDGEGGVALDGEVRDGLTKVAVVMNNLVDGVPELHERMPVRRRRDAYLGQRRAVASCRAGNPRAFHNVPLFLGQERSCQLLQEHRDSVSEL